MLALDLAVSIQRGEIMFESIHRRQDHPSAMESQIAKLYRRSPVQKPKLKIGLLLDSPEVLAWCARIIDDIRVSDFAELSLVVYHADTHLAQSSPSPPMRSVIRLLKEPSARRQLLYNLYAAWDAKRLRHKENPFALSDCSTVLHDVPSFDVVPITRGFTHRFPSEVVDRIRSYNLDVLMRFGFNLIRGDILRAARYGIWSFHHGDNDYYRGGPSHFWELVESSPTTGVILQVLNDELDAGLVLAKGVFATQPGLFLSRNRYGPYWGTTHLVIQKLYELHRYGWDFVQSKALAPAPYCGKRQIYRTPSNSETLMWLTRETLTAAKRSLCRQFAPERAFSWRVGIRFSKRPLFEEGSAGLASFGWIEAPRGHWFADPMVFEHDARWWLFVEDFDVSTKKAVISVAEIARDGTVDVFRPCLTLPFHVSYPLVFAHHGDIFMLPETKTSGQIELYRAVRFPFEWKLETVLAHLQAVDTTPVYHQGRWWFFTTIPEPKGCGAFCFLFTAETLTAPWRLHPRSPIAYSMENARNAGPIVRNNESLLRLTQSAYPHYGYSFTFHDITVLDPQRFEQQRRITIEPIGIPHLVGTHAYSRAGDLEAIDGCRFSALPTR